MVFANVIKHAYKMSTSLDVYLLVIDCECCITTMLTHVPTLPLFLLLKCGHEPGGRHVVSM